MPICIECSYPVSQLYHVLHSHSHNHQRPPPLPPKPKSTSATPNFSKKTGSKSTGSLRGLHESVTGSLRSSDTKTSEETEVRKNEEAKSKKIKGGLGGDVRLMQCPRCKRFADKYVEHDFVVLFIDLVLVKPQVYRHLLFNRLHTSSDALDPSIIRLAILLLLFDVYITWSHIERLPPEIISGSRITSLPLLLQYLFFVFLGLSTTVSQHVTIRCLAGWTGLGSGGSSSSSSSRGEEHDDSNSRQNQSPNLNPHHNHHQKEGTATSTSATTSGVPPQHVPTPSQPSTTSSPKRPNPNAISTALIVSSCMSLFPILMVVWKYDDPASTFPSPPTTPQNFTIKSLLTTRLLTPSPAGRSIDWMRTGVSGIVAVQNWEALRILLGCGYFSAAGLVLAGFAARWLVRGLVLWSVGLGDVG